jgi:hypothetical protein
MNFHIQERNHELTEGYFILSMKYSVVFSIGWMLGILIIYTYPCMVWTGDKYPPTLLFLDKYHIISWFCVVVAFFIYTQRVITKFNNKFVINFLFNDNEKIVTLDLLNIYNGKVKQEIVNYGDLKIQIESKSDRLYGNQRIFNLLDSKTSIFSLNIDRSAWRKHPEVEELISKLNQFKTEENA